VQTEDFSDIFRAESGGLPMHRAFVSRVLGLALVGIAVFALASVRPLGAQEDDPVKAALEAAAHTAATARAGELLRDPATPFVGSASADVVLVKFVDYQCPYCKAVEPKLDAMLAADKGLKIVMKEFPILGPDSIVAAKAALAAGKQGKYAPYHHALMAYRGKLSNDVIFATAKDVGLDVERLKRDMAAPDVADQIIANFNLARAMKISLTPAYVLGSAKGMKVLSGVSAKTMTGKIDFPAEVAAMRK